MPSPKCSPRWGNLGPLNRLLLLPACRCRTLQPRCSQTPTTHLTVPQWFSWPCSKRMRSQLCSLKLRGALSPRLERWSSGLAFWARPFWKSLSPARPHMTTDSARVATANIPFLYSLLAGVTPAHAQICLARAVRRHTPDRTSTSSNIYQDLRPFFAPEETEALQTGVPPNEVLRKMMTMHLQVHSKNARRITTMFKHE